MGGGEELQKQGHLSSAGEAEAPTHLEELVVEDLIQGEPVAGVLLQDARDEFLRSVGDGGRQAVLDFLDALVRLLQVEGLKRRVAAHQRVPDNREEETPSAVGHLFQIKIPFQGNLHDTTEGPDIRLRAVTLSVEHLWGQVIGSPADGSESKHAAFFNPSKHLFCVLHLCAVKWSAAPPVTQCSTAEVSKRD